MTKFEEIVNRLETAHSFFGDQAKKKGEELITKFMLEGAITQEEFEQLLDINRDMKCDKPWIPEGHND